MLSYISPSTSAAPSPRAFCSPKSSPNIRGIVHSVTPPPFALASEKSNTLLATPPIGMGRNNSTFLGSAVNPLSTAAYGTFDYDTEASHYLAKRVLGDMSIALKELEEILMGDVESSESSSDEDEQEDLFHNDFEEEAAGEKKRSITAAGQYQKPSKGWRKGVARESVRFQLLVDVPCWEPGCYTDLSTMHALRDKTLKVLHNLVDSLHLRGVRTSYRLQTTANGGAWGCIRVAPFMSSRLPPSALSHHYHAKSPLSAAPVTPSSILLNRRSTVAGSLPVGSSLMQRREMDEKEKVAKRIRLALEKDGEGIVEENRTYLLAVNGQPALIMT